MTSKISYRQIRNVALGVGVLILLFAGGCSKSPANIGQVAITPEIDSQNRPIGGPQLAILATTQTIYLSVQVIDAQPGTNVGVQWRYLTGSQILATESFRGGRTQDSPHEFLVGPEPTTSFLASQINLSGFSWPLGSYEVVVSLNGTETDRVGFNVVSDKDFDEFSKKAMLKSFYLGSRLNSQGQIAVGGSDFERSQESIYAVALLENVPAGTTIRAVWKYLDDDKLINDFSTSFSGSGYIPFDISLNRFSRLWPDGLWPVGTFEVSLYVDNVLVTTKNFTVS